MEPGVSGYREERSRLPVAIAAGAGVVLVFLAGLILLTRTMKSHGPAAEEKLPFGAAEQAYSERIHFMNVQMARATNFLNQEFTYVAGTTSNDGTRTVRALEVTLEFRDPMNQVVLRETQRLIGHSEQPLDGGQRRPFQITLEHVPVMWDQRYPSIRVSGLILE